MNLSKLSYAFYKLSQQNLSIVAPQLLDQQEKNLFLSHLVQIKEKSEELVDAVKEGIPFKMVKPEALSHIQNLHNGSIRLHQLSTPTVVQVQSELDSLYKRMMDEYNLLERTYLDKTLEQMKLIKDSLAYIGSRTVPENE